MLALLTAMLCCCYLWVILHIEKLRQQLSCLALYAKAAHTAVACWLKIDFNHRHTPVQHNSNVHAPELEHRTALSQQD